MKRSLLKWALIALFLFSTTALVFATGGRQPAASTGTPVVQIGIQQASMVSDYQNNYLTRYVENLHNVRLDFYVLPQVANEFRTRVALMAASNDLPETLWTDSLTRELIQEYGSSGFLVPLNRYFSDASKTPWFNRLAPDDRAILLRDTVSPDGNNYSFARYQPITWNMTPYNWYMNNAWLQRLGLQPPKTTDELRTVLIAFRDRDPNGNGRQDEIPLIGQYTGGWGQNIVQTLINSFIYYNGTLALDPTGRTVTAPVTDPAFRQALVYINGLFRERLIDASTFTLDTNGFRALLNASPPVIGLTSMGSFGHFTAGTTANPNPTFVAMTPLLPPLRGPGGVAYTPFDEHYAAQISFITNKARDVDLIVKIMDSFYEPDLTVIARYGEKDVNWTRDPAVLAGLSTSYVEMGMYPAVTIAQYSNPNVWSGMNAIIWGNLNPRFTREGGETIAAVETRGAPPQPYIPGAPSALAHANNYEYYLPARPQYLLPQLPYTAADGAALAQPITNINTYVTQSVAEFVTGTRDINSDAVWNAYLRELDNMGLQNWLRIAQATFNRLPR